MADIWTGIIGLTSGALGATVGVAVNEVLRRRNRIEGYSSKVFERRLDAYEQLSRHMLEGSRVAERIMEDEDFSLEQRHAAISIVVADIAKFSEENTLYLDGELSAHCLATFMGAEDVLACATETERYELRRQIRDMYNEARRMIAEDSGIAGLHKLFKKVTKPKLSGAFIDLLRSEMRRLKR